MKPPGFVPRLDDGCSGLDQIGVACIRVFELDGGAGELVNTEFAFLLADFQVLQAKALFAALALNPAESIERCLGGFRVTVGRKSLRVT